MKGQLLLHFKELRKRLILCSLSIIVFMILSYTFFDYGYEIFSLPFKQLQIKTDLFYIQSVIEAAILKIKFSLIFGIVLSIPVFIFHITRFSLPGLKKNETRLLISAIVGSTILSIISFLYGYFIVLPTSITFLMSAHFLPQNVGILLNYSENLFFVINIIAYLIVIFQFPIILLLLLKFNIVTRKKLLSYSRYIIVMMFILSAILTPPDVVSQLLLSFPLIILFFSVILLAKLFKVGKHV